jgi:hypothetical protein
MGHANGEPMPSIGKTIVVEAVIADHRERAEFGQKKYGRLLETHNGRNALVDAYQEVMDASLYFKQALMEYDDVQKMALKQLWKPGSENPPAPGDYPVILADTNGDVTPNWSSLCWDGKEWDLGIFTEGVSVVAWFDIPPYSSN